MKRENVLDWDEYFMAMAHLSALRSKDPARQVGACLVNPEKRVVGLGYNGFPYGCDDDLYPWEKHHENPEENKYPYVVHAELNAILNSIQNLSGCTLYVSLFPCNECAKAIIQSGIAKVIYEQEAPDTWAYRVSRRMLQDAGVQLQKLDSGIVLKVEREKQSSKQACLDA